MDEVALHPAARGETSARMHLVIYFPRLAGGGAERLYLNLLPLFLDRELSITILVDRDEGELAHTALPDGVKLETLGARRTLASLPRLVTYLRRARPDIVLSAISINNVNLLLARLLAGRPARRRIRVVVSQHNALSAEMKRSFTFRMLPLFYRALLGSAHGVVAVSRGVARDLARHTGFSEPRIQVIYNGVVDAGFAERAAAVCPHPWFTEHGVRVFVAVGRLTAQKDFSTLLRAFAAMAPDPLVRLVVLGEGPLRGCLTAEAASLGIAGRVDLPGYVQNPLAYVARANALVLSSRYEGFGLVLAEALACGTQVISTDCPHGPSEILSGGTFGKLVAVGDAGAMAAAMTASLNNHTDRNFLKERGENFSLSRCADSYLRLFDGLFGIPKEMPVSLPPA